MQFLKTAWAGFPWKRHHHQTGVSSALSALVVHKHTRWMTISGPATPVPFYNSL